MNSNMRGARKRSREQYEGESLMGVGDTLSRLRDEDAAQNSSDSARDNAGGDDAHGDDGWQTVEGKRSKKRKKTPKNKSDSYPHISHSSHARLQSFVKLGDLQNLILYMLADGAAPQWCSVRNHANVKKVVALMVPGLEAGLFDGSIALTTGAEKQAAGDDDRSSSAQAPSDQDGESQVLSRGPDDYYPVKLDESQTPDSLRPLVGIFEHMWPIKSPGDDKFAKMHSPLAAMLTAPISKTKEEKKFKGPQPPAESKGWKNKRTPITDFIASTDELADEGYTLHPAHFAGTSSAASEADRRKSANTTTDDGWVDTANIPDMEAGQAADRDIEQGSVTVGRKILAMDCEMCITSPKGVMPQIFSLTRISLIDWDGNVIMDELVRPPEEITDYLTPYSGITPAMLENVTTTLKDIHQKLLSIITPQTILIGHSLNSDLNALRLTHPFIIDTTLLFPHPRGPPLKSSLKWLAQKYLSREIQKGHGSTGHNSIEDARACLDLVKQKCERGKTWGTSEANGESIFRRLSRSHRPKRDKVNPSGDDEPRTGAVVDWGDPSRGYGSQATVQIGCETDAEVVAGIQRALTGDDDDDDDDVDPNGSSIPTGGCDLVWARFRELEAHRGWWNKSKLVDSEALRSSTAATATERSLDAVVRQTARHIAATYAALPPCTALVVYSGSADPRELTEMQELQRRFREEYKVKKWDQLSVQWTDVEEQKLRRACQKARRGIGFITVK